VNAASSVWLVKVQGAQKIALKAVSAPLAPKIGYFARCKSTSVKLNSGIDLDTVWKAIPVNNTSDVYELVPDQLSSCKSVYYTLGVKTASGSTSSACGRIVSLVQDAVKTSNQDKKKPTQSSSTPKMLWKFTRVKAPASPPPKRPPPPKPSPPVKLEKTIVASVTYITQQNGLACSSLSTAELKLMTDVLCAKQINYTIAQGWPKQQTTCNGTASCLTGSARQSGNNSSSTSQHFTNLNFVYSETQNQTAVTVANDLSQALVESQNFYGINNNLPSGSQVSTSNSTVITPGGSPSPIPSPSPSPSPTPSPSPSPAPIFVPSPVPEPVPTPSGGGGGGGGTPAPPPLTAPTGVNAGTITSNSWTTTFTAAVSAQSYKIQCFNGAGTCGSGGGVSGTALNSAASGALTASITGLNPVTSYTCYVISYSAAGATGSFLCSSPATTVLTPPPPPTSVTTTVQTPTYPTATSWGATFTAASGAASYNITCVTGAGACDATGILGNCGFDSSATGGTLQIPSGGVLNAGTTYNCFVLSYALVGGTGASSCSSPAVSIQTLPQKPTSVATVAFTEATWTGSWTAASAGAQSYKINCIPPPTRRRQLLILIPACASGGTYSGPTSSTGGTITGLAANTIYQCYAIAYASPGGTGSYACSTLPTQVTTGPAVVTNIAISADATPVVSWTLPIVINSGISSLKVNCNPYTLPAAVPSCQTTTALNNAVNSAALASTATSVALSLDPGFSYACYTVSYNGASATGTASCSAVQLRAPLPG
jgi:hypothetical protein